MTATVEIAEAEAHDALGVFAVIEAAFGQDDEAKLVVALERERAIVLSLVAKRDGDLVGSCVFSRVRLEGGANARPAVALAPLAVAPAFQRQGLGALLVRDGLARLEGAGERLALVVGEPPYYGRFGFSSELAADIETPWNVGPALQALVFDGPPPGRCRAIYAAAFGAF